MSIKEEQEKYTNEFSAKGYLQSYYAKVDFNLVRQYVTQKNAMQENMRVMIFLNDVCSPLIRAVFPNKTATMLELGGGPTLYQLLNIADDVHSIDFTDFVEGNLDEIRKWKGKKEDAFNWDDTCQAALMLKKDSPKVTKRDVQTFQQMLRRKIKKIYPCDALQDDLGIKQKQFDIINAHFLIEAPSRKRAVWLAILQRIYKKLSPDGILIMSTVKGVRYYHVGDAKFPAAEIYEKDLMLGLKKAGFTSIRMSTVDIEAKDGYEGIIFTVACK